MSRSEASAPNAASDSSADQVVIPLLDRELLIVTGKGGTGKTSVAASLACIGARSGKRVLLCEIDSTGDIGACLGVDEPTFEPREVAPGLFFMRMDTEEALREYLKLNLKLPVTLRLGPFARAFDFVATAAPGVREVLTIGKLCWEVKRDRWDIVIADAPASGHVVSQIQSPTAIGGLVGSGPLDRQTAWMQDILRDEQRCGAVIVTTPDEVPISETVELIDRLREETRTPLASVVVNRTLPELFSKGDSSTFNEIVSQPEELTVAGNPGAVLDVARLGLELRRAQNENIGRLLGAVPNEARFLLIPQVFGAHDSPSVVDAMTATLAAELE